MKKCFLLIIAMMVTGWAMAQAPQQNDEVKLTEMKGLQQKAYVYRSFGMGDLTSETGHLAGFTPFYLIYPDTPLDEAQSLNLVKELGIDKQAKEFSIGIAVVNPVGASYNNDLDFKAYTAMLDSLRAFANLKVIGIGNGATFVNQTLANRAGEIAGILSINGKAGKAAAGAAPVPAFIVGKNAANIAKPYIANNKAQLTGKEKQMQIYTNAEEPLLRVVVSNTTTQSLGEIFQDAWDTLLKKNYRFNNYRHTWYEGQKYGQYGVYELEPFLNLDDLKVKRNIVVNEDRMGQTKTLWYEYIPEGVMSAEKGTVPLVLLLHGNNNDPRTQADTSGWIQLAAKEKIFVAELEWQGKPGYAAMGHDGIENTVYMILQKYPQLDASRIYTEGLSAGAMTSTAIGIKKSHLFAAIGAMSGGIFPGASLIGIGGNALMNEATQKRGAVETAYVCVAGTDDMVVRYPKDNDWKNNSIVYAWQVYETMNGMDVVEDYDFGKNEAFGQTVSNPQTIKTNKGEGITMEIGYLNKGNVPLMKLVAVMHYGHWNFVPAAEQMWEHFKHFSRDVKTKKLIYQP
jgi:poly(3-hydroxybutyrate) depolymerase